MADISDVENCLLALLTQTVYPTGSGNPSALLNEAGQSRNVQLYRGWPVPDQFARDMAAGTVDISIFPMRVEQNVTRYGEDFEEMGPLPAPTLTLVASNAAGGSLVLEGGGVLQLEDGGTLQLEGTGITLTVGGTVQSPQNVAAIVNSVGYSYGVQPQDTLTSIATGLAALISVDTPANSSGPVITLSNATVVKPRVGIYGAVLQEIARQRRQIMITLWCPTPDLRDNAARLIDPVLKSRKFLTMPDTTECRLIYIASPIVDNLEKQACYRRDLIYSCEYATTITEQAAQIIVEPIKIITADVAKTITL